MNGLAALAYADLRSLLNGARMLRRSPWRALIWAAWLFAVIGLSWVRLQGGGGGPAPWDFMLRDAWICAAIIAFGAVLAGGPARLLGFFRSRAEAVVVVRAAAASPLVVAYLQVRTVGRLVLRASASFAYLVLIALPGRYTDVAGLARELAFVVAIVLAIASVPLPRALARGPWRIAAIVAGWSIGALGVLPLLRDVLLLAMPSRAALTNAFAAWHPGASFAAVQAGRLAPLGIALAVALVASVAFVIVARDAYPELYEISLANLEFREAVRARRSGRSGALPVPVPRSTHAASERVRWRGVLALVWLDALQWSRRVSRRWTAFLLGITLGGGAIFGWLERSTEADVAFVTSVSAITNMFVALSAMSGVRIATDLRRPIWWLGTPSLFERLVAWTFSPLWRDALFLVFGALGMTLVTHEPGRAVTLVAGGIALAALTRAVGVATFALLPDALDQRGPATLVKVALSYTLVAPPVLAAFATALVLHGYVWPTVVGGTVALTEAGLLIAFATWRLSGRVDRLASA